MDDEKFQEFNDEVIPSALFHVEPTDIDDDTGGKLEEVILIRLIANNPECLKHRPLQWFIDTHLPYPDKSFKEIEKEVEKKTAFEIREWNYSFDQGMVVKFADDLPEGTKVYEGPGYYLDPKDFGGKIGIVIECWSDLHSFASGTYYYCKVNFGSIIVTAPAQYFVELSAEDKANIK